jgi:hypothetical protein
MDEPLIKPILSAIRAITHLLCHVLVAAVILIGIRVLELLIQWLWQAVEPMLFGVLPLRYLVHGVDLGVLLAFGFYGIISSSEASGPNDDQPAGCSTDRAVLFFQRTCRSVCRSGGCACRRSSVCAAYIRGRSDRDGVAAETASFAGT